MLSRLGPKGYLINIGRGSLIETNLLAEALRDGTIAGAGIDVYETEPARPEALIELDNLLITPHLAGWSPEATQAQLDLVLANLDGFFSGKGRSPRCDLASLSLNTNRGGLVLSAGLFHHSDLATPLSFS